MVAGKALPDAVIDQIADRTDGVPLFVEELTKSVLESGLLRTETDRYVIDGAVPPSASTRGSSGGNQARGRRFAPHSRMKLLTRPRPGPREEEEQLCNAMLRSHQWIVPPPKLSSG